MKSKSNEFADEVWKKHIDVFESFDLVCNNGHSLEDETKSNALFNSLVTLESMKVCRLNDFERAVVEKAIEYLKGSKYYSEANSQSDY